MAGISPQNILCNIAENETLEKRLSCTNMQDFTSCYGLKTYIIRHENDLISVDSYVKEVSESEENPICYINFQRKTRMNFLTWKEMISFSDI